jgi:hypothetical protein
MYTHLLLSVFEDWVGELAGAALVDYAVVCRIEMLASNPDRGEPASLALAAEVSYDRALIKLCTAHGIEADALGFSHPGPERARLERDLAAVGIDLVALARQRQPRDSADSESPVSVFDL